MTVLTNLEFKYVVSKEKVSFYKYMDFKKLFDKIKSSHVKFSEVKNKQKRVLK